MSEKTFSTFVEDVTIEMPHFDDRLTEFVESATDGHKLIIEMAAIHEGLTANFNFYPAEHLSASLESWTNPYPKPIILNHDLSVDPIGRVMNAQMDKEMDGSEYVRLQFAITDPKAIEKVMDGRYLTGSVGGRSKVAKCSVCETDWASASIMTLPCKHVRGKIYKGKLAYMERQDLSFYEYSFVNAPADSRSVVKSIKNGGVSEAESDAFFSMSVYGLDMDSPSVIKFTESENVDILSNMRKKEAIPLYHQLKGSFLSAIVRESTLDEKESEVEDKDDVLAVVEGLSNDLSGKAASDNAEEAEVSEDEVLEEETSTEDDAEAEASENTDASESDDEGEDVEESDETESEDAASESEESDAEEVEEATPQAQESPRTKDRDSNFAKPTATAEKPSKRDADKTRDSDDDANDLQEEETVEEGSEEGLEDSTESVEEFERRIVELEASVQSLSEENARLKRALHNTLAERVVDTKIALGMIEQSDREEALKEHASRTAASLADSLRDLISMPSKATNVSTLPDFKQSMAGTKEAADAKVETVNDSEEIEESNKKTDPEQVFVDTLMGRRML